MIGFTRFRALVPLAVALLLPAMAYGDPPSFGLKGDNLRQILRDAARLQIRLRPDLVLQVPARTAADAFPSPQYAARIAAGPRFAVMKTALLDCGYLYCTEYDSTGRALSAVTRETFFSNTAPAASAIPVCQSNNDMLPTWERFENCGSDKQRRNTRK